MGRPCDLLIVGGVRDPCLPSIAQTADAMGCESVSCLFGTDRTPLFSWDPTCGEIGVDGRFFRPRAAFLRHDVFSFRDDPDQPDRLGRAEGWFAAVAGAVMADPDIRLLNRYTLGQSASKPAMLSLAQACGLAIPRTLVTNEVRALESLQPADRFVAKPVAGGAYCHPLDESLAGAEPKDGKTALPAIVQQRLSYPEYRVYLVAGRLCVFEVRSDALDYRLAEDSALVPVAETALPEDVRQGLRSLANAIALDFGAADLKTDPHTGAPVFLEINNQPMFAAHDRVSGGALSRLIVERLVAADEPAAASN